MLLLSNLIAFLLQSLCARLGVVTGKDLAQVCRDAYPDYAVYGLWILAEIAIIACDMAEVLGTAIALNLLFELPLVWCVVITGLDALLLLALLHYGMRKLEAAILALVKTRRTDTTPEAIREAIRFNFWDTGLSLNLAFLINAAILIVASAVFFTRGITVDELGQAQKLLSPLLGTSLASLVFVIALLSAGLSSTITGTLAGQIVMEGFLRLKIKPVPRRLITRGLAIIPALIFIILFGDKSSFQLLILSQVVLSMQLPFAVFPLVRLTGNKDVMGDFASTGSVTIAAWVIAIMITALNIWLIVLALGTEAFKGLSDWTPVAAAVGLLCLWLLLYVAFSPIRLHAFIQGEDK